MYNGKAHRAVDGNTSGKFSDKSFTHTADGNHNFLPAWWTVDLQATYNVDHIVIYNRGYINNCKLLKYFRVILCNWGTLYQNWILITDCRCHLSGFSERCLNSVKYAFHCNWSYLTIQQCKQLPDLCMYVKIYFRVKLQVIQARVTYL